MNNFTEWNLHGQMKCDVSLLLLTPEARTSDWGLFCSLHGLKSKNTSSTDHWGFFSLKKKKKKEKQQETRHKFKPN